MPSTPIKPWVEIVSIHPEHFFHASYLTNGPRLLLQSATWEQWGPTIGARWRMGMSRPWAPKTGPGKATRVAVQKFRSGTERFVSDEKSAGF